MTQVFVRASKIRPSAWLILLLILASVGFSQAQDKPADGVWSLEECIKYAIKNNVTVMQNELQVDLATSNLQQSRASRYPSVNASASQALSWGRNIDPGSNQFITQRINSNNFGLQASVPIFNGMQIHNTIKQNQTTLEVNQLNVKQIRNTTALLVATNYLNVLLNKELLNVAEKNVASTKEQLDRTEKLFNAGSIAENDVINLRATLANNELAVVNARNQLDIAKANIQQAMNYPIAGDFEVEDVPIESLTVNAIESTTSQIYSIAEKTQYNIRSADKNIESSQYGIEIAKAGRYPTLNLTGSLFTLYSSAARRFEPTGNLSPNFVGFSDPEGTTRFILYNPEFTQISYPFGDQLSDNFRQQVSLNLNIPIFNGWQVRNQIARSTINKRNAELQAQTARNQLRIDIENAYVTAKSAYNTYEARVKQLEAQELAFITNEKRYNAGAANVVDFNIARINRDNARSDLVRAKYDYLFRKKVLDFYEDKPLYNE
ncbi:MAG: TolC family protein [Microscillaceae bacterium]|jgi:outer membrane protein|nr:TolC family protein [Microscillaceae bacterium]